LSLPIVELYINSVSEFIPDNDEESYDDDNGDDERGCSRIDREECQGPIAKLLKTRCNFL
jgi:hypothetical protein